MPPQAKVELLDMFAMVVASQHIEQATRFWAMLESVMANAFVDEDRTQPVTGADGEPLVAPEIIAAYHLYRTAMAPMMAGMLAQAAELEAQGQDEARVDG